MRHETIETGELSYSPCRYGNSRMLFRGPRKRLDLPYLAFIGGTETYGKFIEKPFPTLVEKAMRQTCVNFGCVNGGIDAFVNDPTVMDICAEADLTVVQVMGANYLSNRFYSVHPRRNDRFLRASTVLQAIYQEIDFSEFSFTRHMLGALHATSLERFETVVIELRAAWLARMRNMLGQIGRRTILLWFSEDAMSNEHWADRPGQLQVDPLFITASMIDELRPLVKDVVVVNPTQRALSQGSRGMYFPTTQTKAASEMLGVDCHVEAGAALIQSIRNQLYAI
ncbi:hypothetical protein AN191_11105 [Loktanella sp. 5RATIMAR09]|uniref:DUF6473 family protein n=1 Tax=Loktanella sp. 5RATIMAR09 TaxID=1225655 RepID=UPI0006EB72FF|nr:DUF6473 family protein [Loktanella sp. 5RATIMAR09]KQI71977.1 hypothetical protein AN191_11105 [Loktanella sp. 5RATIMAR09]